jgi:3-methyladenine DNA glycosylase Tag
MSESKKKPKLAQVLKLVDQLSPEELLELKLQLDIKAPGLNWLNVDLGNPSERAAFFAQEDAKAGKRVKQAFEKLQKEGIVDAKGKLIKSGLPADMQPGSGCDVGG